MPLLWQIFAYIVSQAWELIYINGGNIERYLILKYKKWEVENIEIYLLSLFFPRNFVHSCLSFSRRFYFSQEVFLDFFFVVVSLQIIYIIFFRRLWNKNVLLLLKICYEKERQTGGGMFETGFLEFLKSFYMFLLLCFLILLD